MWHNQEEPRARLADPVARQIRLRPWQKDALEAFAASEEPDFLAVATPGAGKTTFALTAALRHLADSNVGGRRRLVVVAPTAHLKYQWSAAAAAFGIHLDPAWSASEGPPPSDMHGVVTTYQQVATSAGALRSVAAGGFVIFDEIHHAGDDRAWGQAVLEAFGAAARRLALSGTPFRSDTRAIPFIRYELEEAKPDFEYGYGEALSDGRVVRPIYFPRTGGNMEWSAPDGSIHEASFDDPLDRVRANQRLRTALSVEGEWLPSVLRSAHERLTDIRRTHPSAGGLVIAIDVGHARAIAESIRWRFGIRAKVATSDDSGASEEIARFAAGSDPWLVAVRMVSEGVDIPRLRVGVFATTTTTELFFRQAVGRFVRWTRGVPNQRSYLYIPDDHRLRARAFQISETRRHSLRRDRAAREVDPAAFEEVKGEKEQLSLFAAISAVATDTEDHESNNHINGEHNHFDDSADEHDGDGLVLDLPALAGSPSWAQRAADAASRGESVGGARSGPGTGNGEGAVAAPPLTRRQQKTRLRDANARLARDLARKTGWSHAQVNAELNRLSGLRRVTEATLDQLEARLRHAEAWYRRL